jgi:hypothetical protein
MQTLEAIVQVAAVFLSFRLLHLSGQKETGVGSNVSLRQCDDS